MWVPNHSALLRECGLGDITSSTSSAGTIDGNNSGRIGDGNSSGCDGSVGVREGSRLCCFSRECDGCSVDGEGESAGSSTKSYASKVGLKGVHSTDFGSRKDETLRDGRES